MSDALERVKGKLRLWPDTKGQVASVLSVDDIRTLVREVEAARELLKQHDMILQCQVPLENIPEHRWATLRKAKDAYDAARKEDK